MISGARNLSRSSYASPALAPLALVLVTSFRFSPMMFLLKWNALMLLNVVSRVMKGFIDKVSCTILTHVAVYDKICFYLAPFQSVLNIRILPETLDLQLWMMCMFWSYISWLQNCLIRRKLLKKLRMSLNYFPLTWLKSVAFISLSN